MKTFATLLLTSAAVLCKAEPTLASQIQLSRRCAAKQSHRAAEKLVAGAAAPQPASEIIVDISFANLKLASREEIQFGAKDLSPTLANLLGKRVRIKGFMMADPEGLVVKRFALRGDMVIPNRGGLFRDNIDVSMAADRTVEYTLRPVTVEGVLGINDIELRGGDRVTIFTMTSARLARQPIEPKVQ